MELNANKSELNQIWNELNEIKYECNEIKYGWMKLNEKRNVWIIHKYMLQNKMNKNQFLLIFAFTSIRIW